MLYQNRLSLSPATQACSLSDAKASWLLYLYAIHAQTGKAWGLAPLGYRFLLHTYRWLRGRHLFVIRTPTRKTRLRFHFIAIQTPPEFNEDMGRLEFCFRCPDATVRNGKLIPVCMADHLSPYGGARLADIPDGFRETIFSHLGEVS